MSDAIALSIPLFFALMGLELFLLRRRGRARAAGSPTQPDAGYRLDDTLANLGCGSGQQVVGAFLIATMLASYEAVEVHFGLFELQATSPWTWLGALLGVDFLYYWFHRASHRVNFMWAAHVVHHQSERYNLAVALRQSWLQQVFSFFFYLPLAFLGVPTVVFFTVVALDTLYQFWIHTELINRMGAFERVFNTPSHHRVHHGVDDQYLDRNHAGLLITWDKLFKTFEPEGQRPRYGTVRPLRSVNPLWANVEPWVDLFRRARQTRRLGDKLRVFVAPPEWKAPDEPPPTGPLRTDSDYILYRAPPGRGRHHYVLLQFLGVLAGVIFMLGGGTKGDPALHWALGGLLLVSFGVLGGVAEDRRWAKIAEPLRLVCVVGLVAWVLAGPH